MREALIEREVLLRAAPNLTWPLRLILPHSRAQRPYWLVRLGLFLYDHLGGRVRIPASAGLDLRRAPEGEPLRDAFARGFSYYDCWVDDARLVVLNTVDAARGGADVRVRTRVVSARRENGLWRVTLRGPQGESELHARAFFNAAGPWVEQALGRVAGANSARRIRLVKDSHLVLKRWWRSAHGYVLQNDDKRIIFVNPWFDGLALVDATDIPYESAPEDAATGADEKRYLCAILSRYFDRDFTPDDILADNSSVRPLFDDDSAKNASAVTRDYVFELDGGAGRAPCVSAFGGKLTTYRKLAEAGLEKLRPFPPQMGGAWTETAALPGGAMPGADFQRWRRTFRAARPWLPQRLADHYAAACGTEAEALPEGAGALSDLGRDFGGGLFEREARWATAREFALAPEDVIWRRSKHGLFMTAAEKADFAAWMAAEYPIPQPDDA